MFEVTAVNQDLFRISYQGTLAGYVTRIKVLDEVRFRAQLLRFGKLGMSLGEYDTVELAAESFEYLLPELELGIIPQDSTKRWRSRSSKTGLSSSKTSDSIDNRTLRSNDKKSTKKTAWYTGSPSLDSAIRYD